MRLAGRTALVTGASSGIGRALTLALARRGVRLAVAARSQPALEKLADEIARSGFERPIVLPVDLSHPGEARRLGEAAGRQLGGIDILVNNAALGAGGSQWALSDGVLAREVFEVNYLAPLALIGAAVPVMRDRGSGAVVNVTTIGAFVAAPLVGHYDASKAALAMATETLRLELRGSGVHVVHVAPGPIETPLLHELLEVPSGRPLVGHMPHSTAERLAEQIVHALEHERRFVVHPRTLAILRHAPTLSGRISAWLTRRVNASQAPVQKGGITGNMHTRGVDHG